MQFLLIINLTKMCKHCTIVVQKYLYRIHFNDSIRKLRTTGPQDFLYCFVGSSLFLPLFDSQCLHTSSESIRCPNERCNMIFIKLFRWSTSNFFYILSWLNTSMLECMLPASVWCWNCCRDIPEKRHFMKMAVTTSLNISKELFLTFSTLTNLKSPYRPLIFTAIFSS